MKFRSPVGPELKSPWAHRAERRRIRRDLRSRDQYRRDEAEIDQHLWAYKDARLRGDDAAAEAAWRAHRQVRRQQGTDSRQYVSSNVVRLAAGLDDIDRAAQELLDRHPHIDTRNTDTDNYRRTVARTFVSACIGVLVREASVGHPREAAVDEVMRDVAARIEQELMSHQKEGFWRIGELRAWKHSARASGQLAAALRFPDAGDPPPSPEALAAAPYWPGASRTITSGRGGSWLPGELSRSGHGWPRRGWSGRSGPGIRIWPRWRISTF